MQKIMNYQELLSQVKAGARFSVDLKKRTLKINGKQADGFDDPAYDHATSAERIADRLEELYKAYKYSVPSKRSESRRRPYFKALSYDELTDADMCWGEPRETARFELEFYLLRAIVTGNLTWDDSWGSWFWQPVADRDLVILREWVEPDRKR